MTDAFPDDSPDALVRLHGALVFRVAYRVLGDRAQAEDVQQDVFLRLIEAPPQDVQSWPAYLTAAANRRAIDQLRQVRRWWQLLPQWRAQAPSAAPSAEQAGIEHQRARRLRAALATLSAREAQCFTLRYLQDQEIGEIALALGLSTNNVNVSLHRARRRMEAQLGETTETTP
ncbi:RNA polymerase sigma factor [Arenimonas sp. MALMAid1274]|uniref:RNA polymerase sigma factor n=1 Tax=Arenimonas sp. MALMAid1274 TaxID=3411630 RepID=UPI003B9E77E3